MAKVAWIGLGVMGYPMAGHIRTKGRHDLTVYNRNGAKAEAWVKEYGGSTARTPADAAKDAEFVFCCVGNDKDLREVTLGANGAFASLKKGAIFIDNTRRRLVSRESCMLRPRRRAQVFWMLRYQAARPVRKMAS